MAIVKRFNLKGLATKIDDLYKKPEMATDCLNVYKDCSGRIEGRKGVLKIADITCDDMYYSREKQKHFKFTNTLTESSDGIAFLSINKPFSGDINNSIKSVAEINGDIFFSDTELVDPVMKYNGYEYHQAGLPELFDSDVSITYSAGGSLSGDYYIGIALSCTSPNGDKFFGPLYEKKISLSNNKPVVSISTISDINTSRGTKYYDRYWESTRGFSIVNGVITPALGGASTNLVSGDYLKIAKIQKNAQYVIKSVDIEYKKIKTVVAGTPSIITLEDNTINSADGWILLNDGNTFIDLATYNRGKEFQKYEYVVFLSKSDNLNYRMFSNYDMFAKTGVTYGVDSDLTLLNRPSIDEYLDITDSRVQPFKCRYLASYVDKMFCINCVDESGGSISSDSLPYSVFFSSSGEGSSPETMNYSNNIVVGSPDEGQCIGGGIVGNNVVVLKDRATYMVTLDNDGSIGRVSKLSATVGCASNKAILNFDNALCWLSDKGVFALSKTGEPEELTEEIENIFTDNPYSLDFSKSRVAIDRFNEMILFYCYHSTDPITLSYSYKWEEWYLWKGIYAQNGFYHTGDTFFFNDGSKSYKINKSSNNDNFSGSDVAIEHYWSSGWESIGEPTNEKKFNNLVVFSVQNPVYSYEAWDVTVKSDYDWNTASEVQLDDPKSFSSTTRRHFFNSDKTACYSRRFTFYNNTLDQGFSLSGYEFEVLMPQQRMRD